MKSAERCNAIENLCWQRRRWLLLLLGIVTAIVLHSALASHTYSFSRGKPNVEITRPEAWMLEGFWGMENSFQNLFCEYPDQSLDFGSEKSPNFNTSLVDGVASPSSDSKFVSEFESPLSLHPMN